MFFADASLFHFAFIFAAYDCHTPCFAAAMPQLSSMRAVISRQRFRYAAFAGAAAPAAAAAAMPRCRLYADAIFSLMPHADAYVYVHFLPVFDACYYAADEFADCLICRRRCYTPLRSIASCH